MNKIIILLLLLHTTVFGALFGDITIEGNNKTSTDVILSKLTFQPGDQFSNEAINESWEILEDLNWFTFVDMDFQLEDGTTTVTIEVEEESTFRVWPVVDYDRRHDILLGAKLYDYNFRGKGDLIKLQASWYAAHRYNLQWQHPLLAGYKNLTFQSSLLYDSADFVFENVDYTQIKLYGGVKYDLPYNVFISCGFAAGTFELGSEPKRDRYESSIAIGYDTRDIKSYPTKGAFYKVTGSAVNSDYSAYLASADFRHFIPLPHNHILALRAWGQIVSNNVQPEDRLYWGGSDNLRGYQYATIRGDEGFILTTEYRIPLFLMTISGDGKVIGGGLHFFADSGNNWYNGNSKGNPLYSYGAGIHLGIAAQQFRFEVAKTENGKTVFQFMDTFNF